jgi:hypothetical protein
MSNNNNNNSSPRKTIAPPMERNPAAAMTANPQGRVFASMSERTSCATAAAAGVRGSPLVLSSGTFNRRLTATLSPEECKMMFTHTEKVSKPPLFYSKTYSASPQMTFVSCEQKFFVISHTKYIQISGKTTLLLQAYPIYRQYFKCYFCLSVLRVEPRDRDKFHYCWRVKSSFKLVWTESTFPCNSQIGYSFKWRCCSLV